MKVDNEYLRVAILGAPTSGKSALAQNFAKAIGPKLDDGSWLVVDNPTERAEAVGYQLGREGDFRTALALAMFQVEDERQSNKESGTITTGTVLQRLAHTGSAVHVLGDRVQKFPTVDNRRSLLIENNLGHLLAFLLAEEFQYHFIFYLPLASNATELIVPDALDDERAYNNRVDTGLQQLIDAFFIPAMVLNEDDPVEQMVNHVVTSMAKLAEEEAEEAEKPVEA